MVHFKKFWWSKKIDEAELREVEARLQIELPSDYRQFLVDHNGGVPKPRHFITENGEKSSVRFFYAIGASQPTKNLVGMSENYREELNLPTSFLPVALLDLNDLLLVHSGSAGGVYWWRIIEEGFDESRLQKVAGTFDAFLHLLTVESSVAAKVNPAALYLQIEDAIIHNKGSKLRKLLAESMDLDFHPDDSWPLVLVAVNSNNSDALELLLNNGANANVVDNNGTPVIEHAQMSVDIARIDVETNVVQNEKVIAHKKNKLDCAEKILALLRCDRA